MLLDAHSPTAEGPASDAARGPAPTPAGHWAGDIPVTPGADLWVFAYGSLMWDPGFAFLERRPALLGGYHRRFCVASHRYRGTPERPGLVLGLDRGGSCRGLAYRVAADRVPATLDYLWDREMLNRVYRPAVLPVRLCDGGGRVTACTFVVDRRHGQYCGGLDEAVVVERIAGCCGERGPNLDYLVNTATHLEELGVRDERLFRLHDAVRARLAVPAGG